MTQTQLLSIKDVVREYRIGRTTIYERLKTGELKAIKVGRLTRIRRDDIDSWLSSQPDYEARRGTSRKRDGL